MRIHITGNAGAGKTTLAKRLGEKFDVSAQHLDSVVWATNWQKVDPAKRDAAIQQMVSADTWLIEGVSEIVRQNADVVLILQTPRYKCLFRCIKRCFVLGLRTRPELPPGCAEIRILFKAMGIVWRYPKLVGRRLQGEAETNDNYLLINNQSDVDDVLKSYT